MVFWSTTAAISLKRVKIEEKLLWRAYRNSPTLFRTVPSSTTYGFPFFEIGVCNLATPLISVTGKATDCKFGECIYRANLNKSPLKIFTENGAWAYPGTAQFLGYPVPPIISGTGKATDFKCCRNIHRVDRNKCP